MPGSAVFPSRSGVRTSRLAAAACLVALIGVAPAAALAGPPPVENVKGQDVKGAIVPDVVEPGVVTPVGGVAEEAEPAAKPKMAPSEVYRHVLKSVVLILRAERDGDGNLTVGYGTGWVLDKDRGLIVTNQHVVSTSDDVYLIFPEMKNGRLRTALEAYDLTADGFGYDEDTPKGEVIHSENDRDLALIRAYPRDDGKRLPKETEELALADRQVWPGERVHTIAGWPKGSESLWIYGTGTVRQVSQRTLASGAKTTVMESDALINQGNSGGAVVDDAGEVVAVVEGFQTNARGLSLFVGLDAVRAYLEESLPLVDPQTAEQRVALAKSHMEAGRYDRGIVTMNDAIRMEPKNAGYMAVRGLMFAFNGDYETARLDLDEANKLAPNDPIVQGGRGQYLWMRGELDDAIDALTRAIRNDPTNAEYYGFRGLAQRDAEKYDRAVRDLSRAIHFAPHDANLLLRRGEVHRSLEDYDAAIADHRAAAEMVIRNPEPFDALGQDYYAAGQHEQAVAAFRLALQRSPDEGMYHFRLGDALQETGDWAGGLRSLERAIQLMPSHSTSRYYAGLSHHNLGDDQAAVGRYREAMQLEPNSAYIRYNLGVSLRALGQEAEAREQFQVAESLNPDLADPAGGDDRTVARPEGGGAPAADVPAEDAPAFRPIRSIRELAGEWKADFTVNGEVRVQDTTTITATGKLTSNRVIFGVGENADAETTEETVQSQMYIDGNEALIGEPGEVFKRRAYQYNVETLRIEYKELGGTVIWYRQK